MTLETRAARDRLAAFLDAHRSVDDAMISLVGLGPDGSTVELRRSDLQLVLAALDQQPAAILVSDAVLSDAEYEDLKRRFLAAQDRPPRVLCRRCMQEIEFIDPRDGLPGIWRHVEMPTGCTIEPERDGSER